ncbi:MAG: YggS family pyridoxal phosphate-dependent enzyme [Chloroflexi bacterium]|nr:YggS family pyridoxal phosphate-dependent enzyme [Chloroflexota bacterium]
MEIVGGGPPTAARIAERYERLTARLRAAADAGGHDPARLRMVAVTKTWPVDVARNALAAGLTILGESRVQEAEPKVAALPDAEWHLVGRLQSNKARRAVRAFAVIHSVDSIDLLRRLDAVAAEEGAVPRLLLQVNVAGGPTTAGFAPEVAVTRDVRDALRELHAARVVGLMTVARMGVGAAEARATFAELRTLRDRLEADAGVALPELSMGMSADAEAAAAEGATLVRIGTALFGQRP